MKETIEVASVEVNGATAYEISGVICTYNFLKYNSCTTLKGSMYRSPEDITKKQENERKSHKMVRSCMLETL